MKWFGGLEPFYSSSHGKDRKEENTQKKKRRKKLDYYERGYFQRGNMGNNKAQNSHQKEKEIGKRNQPKYSQDSKPPNPIKNQKTTSKPAPTQNTYLCHFFVFVPAFALDTPPSLRCQGSKGQTQPLTLLASLFSPICGSGIHLSFASARIL